MHNWSRYTFTIGAAAALLVGCGSVSQPPIPAPQGDTQLQALLSSRVVGDAGKYSLVYAFRPRDGDSPQTLAYHRGDIFGSTALGGNTACSCGVVFKLSPAGDHYEYTRLHVFTGGDNDGAGPTSLIVTSSGTLYGTTAEGGGTGCTYSGYAGCGTVFKLTATGSKYTYRILYRFNGGDDGYSPALARDQNITDTSPILGTASGGRGGSAFLFKLVRSGNEYSSHVLWNFGRHPGQDGTDAPIVVDGAMYGTAYGNFGAYTYAYRFDSGHFTVLLKFRESDAKKAGRDQTLTASDAAGNLYGAAFGGIDRCSIGTRRTGCGLVFELVAAGGKYSERVLHRFSPGRDGWLPSVSVYDNGALYGTTGWGGTACDGNSDGCGVVFALSTATGKETVLHRFTGGTRGACSCSDVLASPSENELYGAADGGHKGVGAVFQVLLREPGALNAI
jgi:uncharacterized repeat protein (TIGR03803 family)